MSLEPDKIDTGDKLACGIGFKKGLPNYSSIDFHVSISITKRANETDEEFSLRGWAMAQKELIKQMDTSDELVQTIKPVIGSDDAWD